MADEGQATYRITADIHEADRWVHGIITAKCKGYKSYKEAHNVGELHRTFITNEEPVLFMPHVNFMTNRTAGSVLEYKTEPMSQYTRAWNYECSRTG